MSQKTGEIDGKWFRWRNGTKLVDRKWTVVTNLGITISVFRILEWDHFHWKLDFRGLILGSRITQNGIRMQKIYLFKVGWTELPPHVRVNSAARAALDSSSPKMAEIVGLLIFKIKPQFRTVWFFPGRTSSHGHRTSGTWRKKEVFILLFRRSSGFGPHERSNLVHVRPTLF